MLSLGTLQNIDRKTDLTNWFTFIKTSNENQSVVWGTSPTTISYFWIFLIISLKVGRFVVKWFAAFIWMHLGCPYNSAPWFLCRGGSVVSAFTLNLRLCLWFTGQKALTAVKPYILQNNTWFCSSSSVRLPFLKCLGELVVYLNLLLVNVTW